LYLFPTKFLNKSVSLIYIVTNLVENFLSTSLLFSSRRLAVAMVYSSWFLRSRRTITGGSSR